MLRYVSNRLITSVVLALFATLVVFLIANMVPGDPVLASSAISRRPTRRSSPSGARKWGLDLPLWQRT